MSVRPSTEKAIVNSIMRWLKERRGCYALKTHGNRYLANGTPDILGCYFGHMFAIEVKQPGKKPTPLQKIQLARWGRAGCTTGVVHSLDEAKELLYEVIVAGGSRPAAPPPTP